MLAASLFAAYCLSMPNAFAANSCQANSNALMTMPDSAVIKPKANEVIVTSTKADVNKGETSLFEGNVTIFQQQNTIFADFASFNEKLNQFNASGNVALQSNSALVKGDSIFIDENNLELELKNTEYEFAFNNGRGSSELFSIDKNQKLNLDGATFTTCPGDNPSWLFQAGNIFIDEDKGWGEAWNTVFKVGDVPVLYVPYITFPINDKRKSGLLFPDIGSSNRYGTFYSQPIYLNLAENYDMTLTPEYMSKRGVLIKTNVRYMSKESYNELQLNYINEDEEYQTDEARYLGYWQHESNWSNKWFVKWQWTDLSDDNYLNEFGSNYHHQADTYVNNFISANYQSDSLTAQIKSQQISELGPYKASYNLPIQIEANWNNKHQLEQIFHSGLYTQYSYFENNDYDINRVHRLHMEPEVSLDWYEPGYQVSVSGSYLSTFYNQFNQETQQEENLGRSLIKYRALAGLTFEKYTNFFNQAVRQTLEPKMQYLYISDQEQSDINILDTQILKEDYYSLFRDTSYSSIDRISAANQLAIGFTTSIFNDLNNEVFRAGIGQLYRFENDNAGSEDVENSKPAIAIEAFGQISQNWQIDGAILYDQDEKQVESGFVSLNYWLSQDKNFQINHRFAEDVAGVKINQTGLFSSYRLSDQWSVAASYHYDFETDKQLDSMIGFEYRSCCWSVQISAQRQVLVNLDDQQLSLSQEVEYENNFGIKFRLNGLGGDMTSNISSLFERSVFAYRRPYLITN